MDERRDARSRSDGAPREQSVGESRVDHVVAVVLGESLLWPVLGIVIAHAAVFLAPVLVLAVRDRNPFAMAGAVLLLAVTVFGLHDARRRAGRTKPVHWLVACVWLAAIPVAALCGYYGIF